MVAESKIRVALAQIASSGDTTENLATAIGMIERAAAQGAQLVVLPEATSANFACPTSQSEQPLDGPFASGIRAAAASVGVVAIVGMFEPSGDGRSFNTLLVTGRAGDQAVEAAYRKVHLFDAFGSKESDTVRPGDGYVTFKLGSVMVGLATCYDLRFADQFTALGLAGADLVCVAASWGDGPGKAEQWDLLTRARALDSQAWLVACGQAWQPPQGTAPLGVGRSAVIDPLGVVRARLSSAPDLLVMDIDLALTADVRARVPVLASLRAQ